ncbi:HAD family hydrolase [Arthrobacter roseus]|uniref:HAD family hydrolase n=1 Tax=Arthrobacter roseus TaxID=136274 RepID=UPI001963411A|nr:HAD family hydrolase [Arthrobacter roseus]MBM7846923.1 HAD superfamily hydrolase (TIGR01509 family) [Arthrobacter roseus]
MTQRKGVLFDVDGTLVDSNYLHVLSWWQAFRKAGHDVPMAQIHRCVGMGGDKLVAELLGDDRDMDHDEALKASHGAVYSTHWPSLRTLPGARDVLLRAHESGLAVVLASSAEQAELDVLRQVIDADDAIDAATSSTDAEASKPAPNILEAPLEAVDVRSENAVFVGDAVWDVIAAKELGMPCIGVESGGTTAAHLTEAGAVEVYKDTAELLASWEKSAIGKLLAKRTD